MDVTNRFVLDWARQHGGRVLDYGCGDGSVVVAALQAGLDAYGADVFYQGSNAKDKASATGLMGTRIGEIPPDGRLPFPDGYFDAITNNQVMEHVSDLAAVLKEIHRVLKPGGTVLSIFPSVDVWREGHIGIPFAHRFQRGSRIRFYYTWALRRAGLGSWKEQSPTARQWAVDKLQWIDRYTVYRTRDEVFRLYGQFFQSELREPDYIRYRLLDRPGGLRKLAVRLMDLAFICSVGVALFRKLAFMVIVSRKAPE